MRQHAVNSGPGFGVADPGGWALAGPDPPPVRDEEQGLAGVLGGDPKHARDDAVAHLLVALAAVPALAAVLPAPDGVGVGLLELAVDAPGPVADVELAQVRVEDDREPEPPRDDLRGLARAEQVARVDRVDPAARQRL